MLVVLIEPKGRNWGCPNGVGVGQPQMGNLNRPIGVAEVVNIRKIVSSNCMLVTLRIELGRV